MTPLKLLSNRVNRSYKGGQLIEEWQGLPHPADSSRPEEWLASVVEARNKQEIKGEGLSKVLTPDGRTELFAGMIAKDAERLLGKEHVRKFGANPAVLIKVLDAAVRLSIQVHPTRAYARENFQSEFGKTEAWYIMGGRAIDGEPPYVLAGFKPGITRQVWATYFETQDIRGMIDSLHKFYVRPGDVFLIEGGLPHAIGSGCLLIEIQEPTDYTMRVERITFDGSLLPDRLCHQGVGFEKMLDCFIYKGLTREETLKKCFRSPRPDAGANGSLQSATSAAGGAATILIGYEDTPCFSMQKLHIDTHLSIDDPSFKALIVLQGEGELAAPPKPIHNTPIRQGEAWFLPAALGAINLRNTGAEPLDIILCYPPRTPASASGRPSKSKIQ